MALNAPQMTHKSLICLMILLLVMHLSI